MKGMKKMIQHFKMDRNAAVSKTAAAKANWLILTDTTSQERREIIREFALPKDIFSGSEAPEEVSRLEKINPQQGDKTYSLVLTNLSSQRKYSIEQRLEPITFIFSPEYVITYIPHESNFHRRLLKKYGDRIHSTETLIAYACLMIYSHYVAELLAIKKTIDKLDQAARKTTENDALTKLADTERLLVYLDHTLSDQKETLNQLLEKEEFVLNLNNEKLLFDVKQRERHANKLVKIYRDLLETVGGLFSDMMSNNLNHLMKYLDSAALIISIPALVAGLWGMNVGGMPGEKSSIAFLLVIGLSIVLAIAAAFYLSKKDFSR